MISIIVPIYNSEKYLNDCLESLSKLDKNNFEIILINDGSNDNSEKICMHFYRQNTNFRYFYQDNRGVSFARNKGIELAKGEYVIFVDSDDVIISDNLNHLKNINSDLVFATDKKIDDNLSKKQLLLSLFNDKYFNFRSVWSKIYKKSVIIVNKIYFNTKLINGEDFIFNLYFYNKCRDYSIFNKSIYDYRLNDSSCSFSFNKNIVENEIEFFSILESSIESFSLEIDILKLNSIRVCLNKYFFNKKIVKS